MEDYNIGAAYDAALAALLWSETDDRGEPFDARFTPDDIEGETGMLFDQLAEFIADNWADLQNVDPGQCGHDFVLTRNGHGCGFWDRGLGDAGERLTAACKPYGCAYLYLGDDDTPYLSP